MQSEGQVRQKLKQVAFRYLQRRLRENFRKRPATCIHNMTVILDEATNSGVGLCGFPSSDGLLRNVPCDTRIPGCLVMAKTCSLWAPLQTREQIKAEFAALLQSGDRGAIASLYPDLAALMWVLDDTPTTEELQAFVGDIPDEGSPVEAVVEDAHGAEDKAEESLPPTRWWDRIFRRKE